MSSRPQYRCCRSCGGRLAADNRADLCSPCGRRQQDTVAARAPRMPDEFWERPELQAALRQQLFGPVVRAYRRARGGEVTQEHIAGWLGLSQEQVSRIERNYSAVNDLRKLDRWARALRIPQRYLWFSLPDQERTHTPSGGLAGSGDSTKDDVRRLDEFAEHGPVVPAMKEFLDFSGSPDMSDERAALLVADPALFGAITSGATAPGEDTHGQHDIWRLVMDALKRRGLLSTFGVTAASAFIPQLLRVDSNEQVAAYVTTDTARQIRLMVPELLNVDRQVGGDGLRRAAVWCLRKVDLLLNRAKYDEPARGELQSAYGELAHLVGWVHFDAGRYEQARYYYGEALTAAHLTEDLNLEVYSLSSMDMLSRHTNRPREAIQLIQLAQRQAAGWAPPRLAALLASREAVGWAQLGDASASHKAMRRAYHTFHPDVQRDDPAWLSFFDTAQLAEGRALASSHLGQVDQAIAARQSAVDGLSATFQRDRALYSVRLGISLLDAGDQARACEVVQPVLSLFKQVRSTRAHAHLDKFLNLLNRSAGATAGDSLEYARTLDTPTPTI